MNANRRDWGKVAKGGSCHGANPSRGTWVQVVKFSNEFRGFDISLVFPGNFFVAIPPPLDEEL